MKIGYSSETDEHKTMKRVVIQELKKLGYPDSAIYTEEIIKNASPRTYLNSFWFKEFHRGLSEIKTVRKILNDREYCTSSQSRVDIAVKENGRYIAFFEAELSWYPKPPFDAKKKGLEIASIKNDAKLVFAVKANKRSFSKLAGMVLDGIWKVNLEKKQITEKIGWVGE